MKQRPQATDVSGRRAPRRARRQIVAQLLCLICRHKIFDLYCSFGLRFHQLLG
jgi:hypothetical protein